MSNLFNKLLGLWVIGMWLALSALAQADSVVLYHATPSWDQTLPAATRFIVLSNFGGQAVLDRETGLVWERQITFRNISNRLSWTDAIRRCRGNLPFGVFGVPPPIAGGARFGWLSTDNRGTS